MPTAVVDRPHSPVTDSRATISRATDSRATDSRATGTFTRPITIPVRASQVGQSSRPEGADPESPACAAAPEVFLDPVLEAEPVASAPARVRRQYAALSAEATGICASCPLLSACLYRAVVEYDVAGFVAGTTERQRAQIRARLGIEVEPEDFDSLAGVAGGQRTVDHDEVVRLRRTHPDESLERIARRLGCSLSTVKRHLRKERNQPAVAAGPTKPRPTEKQVRRAAAETLAENSGNRRAAA